MVKVLFVVNYHPNEPFAISVAKHAAEELKRQGIEVTTMKVPFAETHFGQLMKTGVPQKPSEMDTKEGKLIDKYQAKTGADLVYTFHAAEPNHMDFEVHFRTKKPTYDFYVSPHLSEEHAIGHYASPEKKGRRFVVENKAEFIDFPPQVKAKVDAKLHNHYPAEMDSPYSLNNPFRDWYLSRTSSLQKSKASGLDPAEFGLQIAKVVKFHVRKFRTNKRIHMVRIPGRLPIQRLAQRRRR
ncbi:MAG: hypothetical protein WCW13_01705 [archaeon]|jgi:hypothetical protein